MLLLPADKRPFKQLFGDGLGRPQTGFTPRCCLIVLFGCIISRLCGKEDSEGTALRSKRPGNERENGEAEGGDSIHIIAA